MGWLCVFIHGRVSLSTSSGRRPKERIFSVGTFPTPFDRLVEVPAWIFDRSLSGYWRSMPLPVGLAPLHNFDELLEEVDAFIRVLGEA